MRQFARSVAVFVAGEILLGACPFLSAADESNVAEQSAPDKSEKEVKRLIDQLGSKRFKDREQAMQELSKLGKSALPSLKEAANSPDPEMRRRSQQLVEQIEPRPVRSIDRQLIRPVKIYL